MTKLDPKLYVGREQTYAKHFVLESYLEKLAYKVGRGGVVLNYVDGFAGPWQHAGEAHEDTSPHIAVRVLRTVRDDLLSHGRPGVRVRVMFIERTPAACRTLAKSLTGISDVEVVVREGEFEDLIPDVVTFAQTGLKRFSFVFIDPCGWTGLGLHVITPLLSVERSEVLINFMTGPINRFIDDPRPQTAATFEDLFGSVGFQQDWQGLQGLEREEAIVGAYCKRVRSGGKFKHVVSAVVINPLHDRTHYHLVYATRHDEGLKTFREIERAALRKQASLRAAAQQKKRRDTSHGQGELFPAEVLATPYIEHLRKRYRGHAQRVLSSMLGSRRTIPFDELATAAMQVQTISEQDARELIMDEVKRGTLVIEGLEGKQRTPQWGKGHRVREVRVDT